MTHQKVSCRRLAGTLCAALLGLTVFAFYGDAGAQGLDGWKIHDMKRPVPAVIDPGGVKPPRRPGPAPSDAIVLFGGKDLSQWRQEDGSPAHWKVRYGHMEVASKGDILTKRSFGDCQLHVEWASPKPPGGVGQHRGNSGIFLMGQYEVQVLDTYESSTYADGQAGAVYAQYPPLVNAGRKPGQWQTYDIIFRAPRFDARGALIRPARLTLLHNGLLVQDNVELTGPTGWLDMAPYEAHPGKLPIKLQDHGEPVRYRNIWIRELPGPEALSKGPGPDAGEKPIDLARQTLGQYIGRYQAGDNADASIIITRNGGRLTAQVRDKPLRVMLPRSPTIFFFKEVDMQFEFHRASNGAIQGLTFLIGGETSEYKKVD